jgi:hypothetical protein
MGAVRYVSFCQSVVGSDAVVSKLTALSRLGFRMYMRANSSAESNSMCLEGFCIPVYPEYSKRMLPGRPRWVVTRMTPLAPRAP